MSNTIVSGKPTFTATVGSTALDVQAQVIWRQATSPNGSNWQLFKTNVNLSLDGIYAALLSINEKIINGDTSKVNSSIVPLTGGASFTGSWEDVVKYDSIVVALKTDQDGTLAVQFSPDGVNADSTLSRYYSTSQIEPPHRFTVTRKYFRVVFTNTSETSQTYFRLQSIYGVKEALNIPVDSVMAQDYDATATRPTKYEYEVALGRRQGATTWNKFGYNADIDIGTEVVAAFGGTFTPLSTASTLTIVSSSVNDDDGGTGANSIVIYGVDENWVAQTEVVTLNGTTNVVTTTQWLGINRAAIYLAGSGKANAGNITITATTGGYTQALIPTGEGTTQQAIYFIQENYTALADFLRINAEKTAGGTSPKVRFKGWVYSAVSNAKYLVFNELMDTAADNAYGLDPSQPFIIGEKSCLWFEATTDTNDTFASVRFSLIEVRDVN